MKYTRIMEDKDETILNEKLFWEQFKMGFEVEKEHMDTVKGDYITVARIVLDQLSEDEHYYTKIKKAGL